jgi:phenylpyruvate tautomerase PptA (4-oxalocrotonate tautomerase family)
LEDPVPQIEFTLPRGALSGDAIDSLMGEMTTTLLRYEGAPDNEASREISWGFVHEVDRVYNGGAPLNGGPARYRVDLTVPEGALTPEKKNEIVGEITQMILAADGAAGDAAAAMRVWVLVHDVPEGNWGGAGRTWKLKEIAQLVGAGQARVPVASG